MSDVEKVLQEKRDELVNIYKESCDMYREECDLYRKEIKSHKEISDKSNRRMFIVTLSAISALVAVVLILVIANQQSQQKMIDFFNQYEYSSEVQTYTVTQDNEHGDNNNYIGNDNLKGGE